jgi:hypothetical protein
LVFPATSSVEQIAAGLGVEDIVIVDNVKIGKNKAADTKLFNDGVIVSLASKRYNLSMASTPRPAAICSTEDVAGKTN